MNDNLILPDPHPSRADAVKNRVLLLETAQRLFDEHGIEAVSMSAVAEAAGVGKGTLYRHFKNKVDLCNALLDEEQRDLQARTLRRLNQYSQPCENLRWFVTEVARFALRNYRLLVVDASDIGLMHPAHYWWRQTILGLLRQLIPADTALNGLNADIDASINATMDADYISDVLYVMLDVRTIRFQQERLGYDHQRILDGLTRTLNALTAHVPHESA